MGIPLIPFVIAFTSGVLAVHALAELPAVPWLAAAAVPALLPWRGRLLWSAMVLGLVATTWHAQAALDARWPAARHGTELRVTGRVASLPEREARTWRFEFAPEDATLPRIRVSWYRTDEVVRAGDCWRLVLRLRTPHGSSNPGGFDYEGWLFRQGIGAVATVRDADRCVAGASSRRVLALRQRVVDAVRAALPEHPAGGLLVALTVGDQSAIAAEDWEAFRRTGTTHLVAISGFNIAIVAAVAFWLCRWAWSASSRLCLRLPAQRAGVAGAALLAGLYAMLAGFEAPVQRAIVMLWLVLAAAWLHRLSRPSRVLALAWLLVLLLDPFAVLSPGLWLSFGAVAAIFYVSLGRVRAPGTWHALVTLQWLLAVALMPLSLGFFHGVAWIAPLVNLAAVPFFTVLTPWALAAVIALMLAPSVGVPLAQSAAWALEAFRLALHALAQSPALWLPASPPAAALLLAGLGVALLFAPRGVPLRALGVLCLVPMLLARAAPPPGGLAIAALDVGQGLAVVVRTARHTLVYDAGPAFDEGFDAGASIVVPYLLQHGIRDVDLLVLSHGDNDHAGGAAAVRRLLHVHGELGTTALCRAGQRWDWDGVRFEVVHPDGSRWRGNNGSCVLRIDGPFSALLPGDIEEAAERALVASGANLRADLLVAPHHGSRTSSTAPFIAAVSPAVVIHSAGWRHHFGHPRREVVERYAAHGSRQLVTGASGAVIVGGGAGALEVTAHRAERRRFWNAAAGP